MNRSLEPDVLVIGGGATGAAILRDLAMRGLRCVLVEQRSLSGGATGRSQGLLHSGGRYAVTDAQLAGECQTENQILRRILTDCIEEPAGYWVVTPWDDPAHAASFWDGCRRAGIPLEEISISQMLAQEPQLNPRISQCFRLPDSAADLTLATLATIDAARELGAEVFSRHQVRRLLVNRRGQPRPGGSLEGAVCLDQASGTEITILAPVIVNASGVLAARLAALAGLRLPMTIERRVLVSLNRRIVNRVISRCRLAAEGDILAPQQTAAVFGAAIARLEEPDQLDVEPEEVDRLLEEGEKLAPGFKNMRLLRAWASLYAQPTPVGPPAGSQAYQLLDHAERDGLDGLVTITNCEWTTHRKAAEATADLVCRKLGVVQPCRTHLEAVKPPQPAGQRAYPGARLGEIEKERDFGSLICECELVTEEQVNQAINAQSAVELEDIRIITRLGMGPCQGGLCAFRATGILHRLRHPPVSATNLALKSFLQERWQGMLPILWGQQLRQARLGELITISLLNADHLPGTALEPPSPQAGAHLESDGTVHPWLTSWGQLQPVAASPTSLVGADEPAGRPEPDVLVIGGGLAGLAAAWQAAGLGKSVRLVSRGWGALQLHTGCIDFLGYHPLDTSAPLASPRDGILQILKETTSRDGPPHPYNIAGLPAIEQVIQGFLQLCADAGHPYYGCIEENFLLPSPLGVPRPTCLASETMLVGDLERKDPILVIGFEGYPDYYSGLIADNLSQSGVPAASVIIDLPALRQRNCVTSLALAELFEDPEFCQSVGVAIRSVVQKSAKPYPQRVGLPAVLGLNHPLEIKRRLEEILGLPVFEIPTLPPSIPGLRLQRILVDAIQKRGGQVLVGQPVLSASIGPDGSLEAVQVQAAARTHQQRASSFILATGGLLGGGLEAEHSGNLREVVCGLPIQAPARRSQWLNNHFLGPNPHPIFNAGIAVNSYYQPVDSDGMVLHPNLYAAGNGLVGGDFLRQRAFDGVALVTGWRAGRAAAQAL